MAIGADLIAHRPAPQLAARHAQRLAENIPQGQVDARDRRRADDAVTVPKVLAIHHLPEVLDPRRVLADEELRQIFDGADDRTGVPFQRRFAPAEQTVLVGENFNEYPIPHPRVADVRFDLSDFHDVRPLKQNSRKDAKTQRLEEFQLPLLCAIASLREIFSE